MAYENYDAFGSYLGTAETEEERRRRLEAEAAAASAEAVASGGAAPVAPVEPTPIKETRTINPVTGEVELTIKGKESDLSAANPNTPTYTGAAKAVNPATQAMLTAVPSAAAYTAQQESSNRPNIGYHYQPNAQGQRTSTAFGTYGLTAPAYQDVQRANPAFANRPITSLSPEEQTQAFETYQGVLGKQLQARGIEPTEANLRGAHLAGAGGLANYLQTGAISPAAAAANGGEEKFRQILQQRLAGGTAPASGATQPVQPPVVQPAPQPEAPSPYSLATGQTGLGLQAPGQPGPMARAMGQTAPGMAPQPAGIETPLEQAPTAAAQQAYLTNQDNVDELMKMRNDATLPEHIRQRAAERSYELMNAQYKTQQAQSKIDQMVAAGDQAGIARVLASKPRDEEGSWLKMIALGFISPQLAGAEAIKLGLAPTKWEGAVITDAAGNDIGVEVQRRADGKIIGGTRADGTKLTPDELNQVTGIAQNIKTLQTQANQSATSAMNAMRKENQAAQNRGLPAPYSEEQVLQRGRDVYRQTMAVTRAGGARPAAQVGEAPGMAPAGTIPAAATTGAKMGVLENWNQKRPGEDVKDYAKRVEMRPEEIESAAQGLVEGRMKPTEFTGRNNDFRRLAIARAAEIDPKYTPQRYDQVQAVVKRYTSGEDHKTLVNTGTAVNHLLQFKEIAKNTPGNTDVSSWNTFYQNLMKYGDAPEIKSKEAMAGFVAGELVKAASGAQGSMTERVHLEQQLMKANTPAEVTAIVDNSIKLAHGRYSSLKSSYEGSTGRKDFDQIVGMPREAKEAFAKLEGQDAAKAGGYSDAEKEARYQEWKRKQGTK